MIRLLLIIFCIANAYGEEHVKYAAVIFRHGDRTPVTTYPTDPWKNESLWPVKFGELTNIGKLQHYGFGKWLRQRYLHLISDNFDPTELYVRSTDVDRTLMSAQANLAGLYPPTGNSVWNTQLMWQPVPVHTVPQTDDEILAMMKACPAYTRELDKYVHSESYKLRLSKYQPLMDFLTRKTGMTINGYNEILDIYSTLYIETLYNFTLPKWAGIVYPKLMQEPACYSFTIQTATPYLARLKVGPLLKHINTHLVRAITDESGNQRKLQLYSGHDLTIGNVLNAMGLYDGKCPCYTSAIFFELIMDNATSTHYVRISYRNTTGIAEPVVLDIPNCGTKCSVAKFMELYENLLTVNWEYECFMQFSPILGVVFGITMFLCIIFYVAYKTHYSRVALQKRCCGERGLL